MIGKTISHYRILEELGRGGMGVVYKAQDLTLDRFVAIKFLPQHLSKDKEATQRFIHEAKAASALDHANIGTLHDVDRTPEGETFIVMAYYEGETLRERIDRGVMTIDEAVHIISQIVSGLARAHEQGIVHRDIKPSNIIVTKRGEAKIIDFGLAKLAGKTRLTKEGSTIGTAAYMSPELAKGEETDHRSDIFSLGSIFYELLAGEPPFKGEHEAALLYEIVHEEAKPITSLRLEVPPELEQIAARAMKKNVDERYQNLSDMAADLKAPERITGTGSGRRAPAGPRRKMPKWAYAISGLVIIIVLLLIVRAFLPGERGGGIESIAVLPLDNISNDSTQEYFADGMTEALITELSRIKALRVISRTSVMRYKKTDKSIPEIARELDVDAIVEGSTMLAGERVRITAQLIDAKGDHHIWADDYDKELRDILFVQKEVAKTIADEIMIALTPEEEAALANVHPVDPAAQKAYLQGRYLLNQMKIDESFQAIEVFKSALDIDPGFALAYAGQAYAYDILGSMDVMPADEAWPAVRNNALKALEIDETLAEAHALLGDVAYLYEWDWDLAEREFKRAIELNPNYAEAYNWYALFLQSMGRFAEAKRMVERSLDLDPYSVGNIVNASNIFGFAGEFSEAEKLVRKAGEMIPGNPLTGNMIGWLYWRREMYEEAIDALEGTLTQTGDSSMVAGLLARAHMANGDHESARAMLDHMLRDENRDRKYSCSIAYVYMALGEEDAAFEWLDRAYRSRSSLMLLLRADSMFDIFRSDPRFDELLKKMNLAE